MRYAKLFLIATIALLLLSCSPNKITKDSEEVADSEKVYDTATEPYRGSGSSSSGGSPSDQGIPAEEKEMKRKSAGGSSGSGESGGSKQQTTSAPAAASVEDLPSTGSPAGVGDPYGFFNQPQIDFQPLGKTFTDPVFGTKLKRVGDTERIVDEMGAIHWERHFYSQLQPFNSDNSLIMQNRNNLVSIRDVNSLELLFEFESLITAPKWNPINENEVYHYDLSNQRVKLVKTNVRTGVTSDVFLFPEKFVSMGIGESSEEVSQNGKWLAAMLYDVNNEAHFVTLNLVDKQIGFEIKERGDLFSKGCGIFQGSPDEFGGFDSGVNWIGVSPSGKYAIFLWNRPGNERCRGVEIHDIETGAYVGHVGDSGAHSDLGVDHNGNDMFVYFQQGYIGMTTFPGDTSANSFDPAEGKSYYRTLLQPGYGHMWHVSCKGPNGVCVVTSDPGGNGEPFDGEVYLIYTDGEVQLDNNNNGGKVRRLAHHRSIDDLSDSSCSADDIYFYRSQPQASMSRDGSYVTFASNWGNCDEGSYTYLVDLRDADISSPSPASGPSGDAPRVDDAVNEEAPANDNNEAESHAATTETASLPGSISEDLEFSKIEGGSSGQVMMVLNDFKSNTEEQYCLEEEPWLSRFKEEIYIAETSSSQFSKPGWKLDYTICNTRKGREYLVTPLLPGTYKLSICVQDLTEGSHFCSSPVNVITN